MRILGFLCAIGACLAGLYAAYLWAKASGIGPQFLGTEPGTTEGSQMWHTGAIMTGEGLAGAQNKKAAFWTGVGAGIGGISSALNYF